MSVQIAFTLESLFTLRTLFFLLSWGEGEGKSIDPVDDQVGGQPGDKNVLISE